ncbi:MAG: shikimate kinase [Gammaproteobacteria bacterium]|nr:shikimate kinase [Gammaproteobacteria bacterium]
MGGYDPRDPEPIARQITFQLRERWQAQPPTKPVMLLTQGDPIEERGISAITRHLADELGVPRAMVFLDPDIADYHKPNADHQGVILEISYSALVSLLEGEHAGVISTLEQAIDTALAEKDQQRETEGKAPLQSYYRDFAMLQEVTKAACNVICGDLTVAHTSAEISPFSVTSFYELGLALGLIDAAQIVPFEG